MSRENRKNPKIFTLMVPNFPIPSDSPPTLGPSTSGHPLPRVTTAQPCLVHRPHFQWLVGGPECFGGTPGAAASRRGTGRGFKTGWDSNRSLFISSPVYFFSKSPAVTMNSFFQSSLRFMVRITSSESNWEMRVSNSA